MRLSGVSAFIAAGLACCGLVCAAMAQEVLHSTITVLLNDGRTIAGELDPQTDSDTLWVRRDTESIILRSGFAWTDIDRIDDGNSVVAALQFRRRALGQPIATTKEASFPAVIGTIEPLVEVPPPPMATARVRSLEIVAYPANWDGDAENDGLRVQVMPLDAQGRIVPVDGQIDCVLVGRDVRRSNVLDIRPLPFPELGRWSRRLQPADFGEAGAIVELPYPARHPEFDRHLQPDALLTARLGVSGQGVFDASDDWVWLRPLSVFRDQRQLFTNGRRTVPAENILQPSLLRPTRTPNRRADQRAR